jgi:hypothetical protein
MTQLVAPTPCLNALRANQRNRAARSSGRMTDLHSKGQMEYRPAQFEIFFDRRVRARKAFRSLQAERADKATSPGIPAQGRLPVSSQRSVGPSAFFSARCKTTGSTGFERPVCMEDPCGAG